MIVYRFVKINSMPLHMRWELYPVPTDPNHDHGGSFMEEVDFASKPQRHLPLNGLKELASEVFFLKKVRLNNKYGIWAFSLAMHWGIYLGFVWIGLMVLERFWAPAFLSGATNVLCVVSWLLGSVGTLGLIFKRATTTDLAIYTSPVEYFNLGFLYLIYFTGLIGWFAGPEFFAGLRSYIAGDLPFGVSGISYLVWTHFTLFELFLIYMPFTRLFHYVAKYFTFDKIFWDDHVVTRGSDLERQIETQLSYRLSWSASHIAQGKSWGEQAAMIDAREEKK